MNGNDDQTKPKTLHFTLDEFSNAIKTGDIKPIYENELTKKYHKNGILKSEGVMGPKMMQGYWRYYYEDGTLEAEKNFKDGKEHGNCKWYLQTGELRTFEVWNYGMRTDCKIYYKSGEVEEQFSYENGIPSYIELFHENGKKKVEGGIAVDKKGNIIKHGLTKWYGDNEELLVIENYQNNVKDGLTKFYYGNGNLEAVVCYRNGELLEVVEEYNEDGTAKNR